MTQQVSEENTTTDDAAPAAGLRVLVVEDEALIRLDLAEMLSEEAMSSPVRRATGSRPWSWPAGQSPTW